MFIEIDAARRRESHIAPRLAQDRRDHPDCGRFAIGPGNRQYRNAAGPSWREEHVDHRFGYIACLAFGRFKMHEIGRASCRERVCQYVSISVVAVSLKKKTKNK